MEKNEQNINPDSLFHFTSDIETLLSILKTGFRFSYSIENITLAPIKKKDEDNNAYIDGISERFIGIPMICFCDIPISRASKHAQDYNEYCIGISKDAVVSLYGQNFKELSFNPLHYVSAMNLNYNYLDLMHLNDNVDLGDLKQLYFKNSFDNLLGFYKRFEGFDYKQNETRRFYDENEWRCLYLDKNNTITNWVWDLPRKYKDAKKLIDELNSKLYRSKKAYMPLESEIEHCFRFFITHIIVKEDTEIDRVIEVILKSGKIFGRKLPLRSKLRNLLLTRITSFERIKKDY